MGQLVPLHSGCPSGDALVDPRNGNTWAVRFDDGGGGQKSGQKGVFGDQGIELDLTTSGHPLTLADWEEVDAIRAGLTRLAAGGEEAKVKEEEEEEEEEAGFSFTRRFVSLTARVAARPTARVSVLDAVDGYAGPPQYALAQVRFGDGGDHVQALASGGVAAYSPFQCAREIREALASASLASSSSLSSSSSSLDQF
jgi:hypothetical protein